MPDASIAMPYREKKEAAVPMPLALPYADGEPARVETLPVDASTTRTTEESAINTWPRLSLAMRIALLNCAAVPTPLAEPALPPARVVTARVARTIARIALLPTSAIKSVPRPFVATPLGMEKRAAVPMPLAKPLLLPATVVTVRESTSMARMRPLRHSVT